MIPSFKRQDKAKKKEKHNSEKDDNKIYNRNGPDQKYKKHTSQPVVSQTI